VKHPHWPTDRLRQVAILAEEAGEVLQAALNIIEAEEAVADPSRRNTAYEVTLQYNRLERMEESLIKEAAQTGAMALRFLLNYHPLYAKVQSAQVKPEA